MARDFITRGVLWGVGDGRIIYLCEGARWHGWFFEFVVACGFGYLQAIRKADSEFVFKANRAMRNGHLREARLIAGSRDVRRAVPN